MTPRFATLIRTSANNILRLCLLTSLAMVGPLLAAGEGPHDHATSSKLIHIVRDAMQQFIDVNNAGPAGSGPAFGCVGGRDHGAIGIHYINGVLVGDGEIDESHPKALIYEPVGNMRRLVGVEYIVDTATWLGAHNGAPTMLEGQAFQFVNPPNRYGIPAFFELPVWAWRDNPNGAFVDKVSCEGQ